tara:strand:+ start:1114 stop:2034 length:921 start_codon:yes stop_codon:yes gene_type:complete
MSRFGNTLFSASPFIRWTLIPVLFLCIILFGFIAYAGIISHDRSATVISSGLTLVCIALAMGLLSARMSWAFRIVTGFVFAAYISYVIYEFCFNPEAEFGWLSSRGASNPRNALLGFVIIGLPCFWYTISGQFGLRLEFSQRDIQVPAPTSGKRVKPEPIAISENWKQSFFAFARREGLTITPLDRIRHIFRLPPFDLVDTWVYTKLISRSGSIEEAWSSYPEFLPIVNSLHQVLETHLWSHSLLIIPKDQYSAIVRILTGDLDEVEVLMAIEEEFDLAFDDSITNPDFTVLDLVTYIDTHKGQNE